MSHSPAAETDYTEIAAALGVSKNAIEKRAVRNNWPFRETALRGGKKRYFMLADLPPEVRDAVQKHRLGALIAAPCAVLPAQTFKTPPAPALAAGAFPAVKPAAGLSIPPESTPEQRKIEWAREMLVNELNALRAHDGVSLEAAMTSLLTAARTGSLASSKLAMLKAARDPRGRKGNDDLPSVRTLYRFLGIKAEGGSLAPRATSGDDEIKPWMIVAFDLARNNPQGRTKKWIHEQLVARWTPEFGAENPVSYDVLATFFREKVSMLDQLKGKWSGSQLRAHTFYQHRTNKGMLPWDEIHADGWNTHFTAPHPVTAEYVTYEVWHAHDVATRYVPPFGVGLTENFEVIAKCVENAVRAGGVMVFLQTDSTRIVKLSEKFKTNPATAIADRAGFTIVHPQTVGNSQANGIAENFNTWLDRESRELATYQNPRQMDELSFKRGRKLTAAMVRAAKAGDLATMHAKRHELEKANKGLVLTSYEQAIAWLEDKRQKWNHKPHSTLPKVRGENGRLRHMTPFEALLQHIEAGWEASLPDLAPLALEQHLIDLFRPHVQLKVMRGTVTPYGGMRYRHAALDEYIGKEVVVAYDMTDWRQVWVKTLKGEPICIADFVEATGYRTLSAQEAAEEKRTQARIRNKERQIEAERIANPGVVVEHRPAILEFIPAQTVPAVIEPEKTLLDFLPEKPAEEERELTYMETVALYMRHDEGDEEEATPKEAAAG